MRTFTLGTGTDRKSVVIELKGHRMSVVQMKPDGSTSRQEKELASEALARSAYEKMAQELCSRGFVEKTNHGALKAKPATAATKPRPAQQPKPSTRVREPEEVNPSNLFDDVEEPASAAPVITRLARAPQPSGASGEVNGKPKKKKKSGKKKRQKTAGEDGLDKRVLAGVAAGGAVFVALIGFFVWDSFLKPASIVGVWQGSRLEFETGGPMSYGKYRLVLDEKKRAVMTIQEDMAEAGTYSVKGNRLKLTFKDKDGEKSVQEYKISLGSATLDLFDPQSGKKVVQLVRLRDQPVIGGGAAPPEAPKDLAGGADADGKADPAADARLASIAFSPKDGAFKLRYPKGWEPETGSRPDNTYSWARFTQGSAKIQVFADIAGSLMVGSPAQQNEEGSEMAPVHSAHMLYKKHASEEYTDYKESEPTLFKGSALGEGRIAVFTASGGGLFGGKIRGYRVTLLTRDRRISVLAETPEADFAKLKPTFLAVCRSLSQ